MTEMQQSLHQEKGDSLIENKDKIPTHQKPKVTPLPNHQLL